MEHNNELQKMIDKAAETVGSKSKLARAMGVSPQKINNWRGGFCTCAPEDRARLAGFAREDALQELVRATLEKTAGTLRGEQLRQLLGKSLRQTIAVLVFASLAVINLSSGSLDVPGAVALFVLWLYSTMYKMDLTVIRKRSRNRVVF